MVDKNIVEVSLYIFLACVAIAIAMSHVFRDLRFVRSTSIVEKNEDYIIVAIKIWSTIFIVLVALLLLISGTVLPMQQLNLFLIIAIAGISIDQLPIFGYLFCVTSALSWYDIYYAFMHSKSGITLSRLLEPKWVVALYCMTSCVLSGHLKERFKVIHIKSSVFQLACIILVWMVPSIVAYLCTMLNINQFKLFDTWLKVPIRLEEMGLVENHRIVCLVFMILLHFGTRLLIAFADSDNVNINDRKKTDAVSPEDTSSGNGNQATSSSPYHKYVLTGNDVEGAAKESVTVEGGELPSDCVEVSEEEAIKLVDGGKNNHKGTTSRRK